jgi:mono/diheme cytochrome c family protein
MSLLQVGASPRALADTSIERGKIFVEENCAGCHAVGLKDVSHRRGAPPFRTLHERYDVGDLAEAFAEGISGIHNGEKQMPEFTALEPEEIDDLIAYLRSVQTKSAVKRVSSSAAR